MNVPNGKAELWRVGYIGGFVEQNAIVPVGHTLQNVAQNLLPTAFYQLVFRPKVCRPVDLYII